MSALLQLIDISFSHSHETLFEGLSLTINQGDKIGLVGHNGTGKSTLLALIKGEREIDSGEIRKPNYVK
ncbi:MAG: ATP-binding cassette domain-containing protein, partial [Psychrosphaera sp.]|nr:ATP-binding cassette domain-containing protein [Psychrosphaera sp.]